MVTSHTGELAALATAACWVITAVAFEVAGKRSGALTLNTIRLAIALVGLTLYSAIVVGQWFPLDASTHMWLWLAASAVFGLLLGDYCLFRALIMIGSRLATLVMASVPLWTALIGWALLGEQLAARDFIAMLLVFGGITWAVLERSPQGRHQIRHGNKLLLGVVFAVVGAIGQAAGLVLSKIGMGDADAFVASQIRVGVGLIGYMCVCTALRWWPRVVAASRSSTVMKPTLVGAIFGPFVGVGLSLLAVQLARNTGVAATLMGLAPIMILPVAKARGEHIGLGGWCGATLAVAGVAVLFL